MGNYLSWTLKVLTDKESDVETLLFCYGTYPMEDSYDDHHLVLYSSLRYGIVMTYMSHIIHLELMSLQSKIKDFFSTQNKFYGPFLKILNFNKNHGYPCVLAVWLVCGRDFGCSCDFCHILPKKYQKPNNTACR